MVTKLNEPSLGNCSGNCPNGAEIDNRSATGCADAGTRAYGAGCISSSRVLSFDATHDDGTSAAAMISNGTSSDTTASGTDHSGVRPTVTLVVTVSSSIAISVDELTVRAAGIVALAVLGLLLAGWRKPARASVRRPRGPFGGYIGVPVTQEPTTLYRRPGPIRRIWALAAATGLSLLTGALIAVLVAFAAVYGVITLTDLLSR